MITHTPRAPLPGNRPWGQLRADALRPVQGGASVPSGFEPRVAFARNFDSAVAAAEAIGGLAAIQPTLLLVFCGGKLDPAKVLASLNEAFPDVPVVGGSAAGAISGSGLGYSGLELGIVAFTDPAATPRVFVNADLLAGEASAGRALGRQVAASGPDDSLVLLFFDSVACTEPLRLHHASSIVDGFQDGLGARRVTLIGGGMLTDFNLSDGWVFDGARVRKHAAVALLFPPSVEARTVILHGCRPVSTFMEITRIDGAEVYELDGAPALATIERMLGLRLGGSEGANISLVATLGEKLGDRFAAYDENQYVNRLILKSDPAGGSITLFEPDFRHGTQVQIMARDNALMLDSVRQGVPALNARLGGDSFLGLYIDCAGRASARSGAAIEEAQLVIDQLDPALPMLGFYSGVEIAPFGGHSRPLDWTGVLTVLGWRT